MWSWYKAGTDVNNWHWDTLLGAHCLHNHKPTGQKFHVFVKYGVIYDSDIDQYLTSDSSENGGNSLNRVFEAPMNDLLYYNGLDSFYCWQLYKDQQYEFSKSKHLLGGFELFMQGAQALAKVQRNGITYDSIEAGVQKKYLTEQIDIYAEKIQNSSEIIQHWKSRNRFNPNSDTDLPKLLYKCLGYEKPQGSQADEQALRRIGTPLCIDIIQYRRYLKMRDTYIAQFDREVLDGKIYPFFSLHIAKTFRSSSQNPNFQNLPKRDKEAYERVRCLLYPSKGNKIIEYDYKGVEVSGAACYNKDKNMLKYIQDETTDMHRDTAADIFLRKQSDVQKTERQLAKNKYVFPSFYGSNYHTTAPALWEEIENEPSLLANLSSHGIKSYKSFEKHIQEIDRIFWDERFPEYKQWKNTVWAEYLKKGYLDTFTGFRCQAPMAWTQATNYPIQGSSFHCLLFTLIHMQKKLDAGRCPRSRIMGQIHDSLVCDVHPEEEAEFDKLVNYIGTKFIRKTWDWIIVPLKLEKEAGDVDAPWTSLKEVDLLI